MSSYSEQVKKDAKAAADIILQRGWWVGETYGPNGQVCAWGAMCEASFPRAGDLREAFKLEVGIDAPVFNDEEGRTKEEVLEVFYRIANS
jgi:hypothetical protein